MPFFKTPLICTLFLLAMVISGTLASAAADAVPREYQIKAAFLYNFTKFVEWPAHHFDAEEAPIIIGVLGRNPFGGELAAAVAGRDVRGRELVVRNVEVASASLVDVLFVPRDQEDLLRHDTLELLHRRGILTIGESGRFADRGGMITFTKEANKVRFIINREAAAAGRIRFSAQLLQLASTIRETGR